MLKRLLYPVCTLVLWAVAGYLALGGIGEPPSASHQEPVHHETTEHHKAPAPPKSLYERATFRQDYTVVSVDKPGPEYAAVSLVTEPTHDKGALAFMAKEQALQHEVNNAFVLAFSSEKAARSDNTAPFAAVQIDIPNEKAAVTFFQPGLFTKVVEEREPSPSEHVPEWRNRKGRHSLLSLIHQRILQIACGYYDQNDSDTLREDPLLKMVCGSLPESGANLASQPTICRLENAATRRCCHQIAKVLLEVYLTQRENNGTPERVLLDFDSTDDPTYGEQEGSYYHGYYGQHMYHPLLVFDGHSGHLITALLRAGNTHASNSHLWPS